MVEFKSKRDLTLTILLVGLTLAGAIKGLGRQTLNLNFESNGTRELETSA